MSYTGLGRLGFGQTSPITLPVFPTEKRKFGNFEYLAVPEAQRVAVLAMFAPYRVITHEITGAPDLGFTKDMEVLIGTLTAPAIAAPLLAAIEAARDSGKAVGANLYKDGSATAIFVDADQLPGIAQAQAKAGDPTPVLFEPKGGWIVTGAPSPEPPTPGQPPSVPPAPVLAKAGLGKETLWIAAGAVALVGVILLSSRKR